MRSRLQSISEGDGTGERNTMAYLSRVFGAGAALANNVVTTPRLRGAIPSSVSNRRLTEDIFCDGAA